MIIDIVDQFFISLRLFIISFEIASIEWICFFINTVPIVWTRAPECWIVDIFLWISILRYEIRILSLSVTAVDGLRVEGVTVDESDHLSLVRVGFPDVQANSDVVCYFPDKLVFFGHVNVAHKSRGRWGLSIDEYLVLSGIDRLCFLSLLFFRFIVLLKAWVGWWRWWRWERLALPVLQQFFLWVYLFPGVIEIIQLLL